MRSNCTPYGIPDDGGRYSRPLPWVGLYIAAASLFCFCGLTIDLYRSLRRRKLWVAPDTFSLNAATLTVLAVATKLPSDITTPMPGAFDQLAKLSGTVLLCIVMNHMMPSLGLMNGIAILSNVAALGILVVTVAINVWIQLHTGVISTFGAYNITISITMMLMFSVFVSSSLTVSTTRRVIQEQYDSKQEKIVNEMPADLFNPFATERLVPYLEKYWLIALTSSPDYTVRSSGMSIVSSILCHGTVGVNFIQAVAIFLSKSHSRGGRRCLASSDYNWSTPLVLALQTSAILVGTLMSVLRSSNSRAPDSFVSWKALLRTEKHWIQALEEWKEAPLPLESIDRRARKIVNNLKNCALDFLIWFQIGVILLCKIFLLSSILASYLICFPVVLFKKLGIRPCEAVHEVERLHADELREYVLRVETNEEALPAGEVVRRWRKHPQRWVAIGRNNQPSRLVGFLKKHLTSEGFPGPGDSMIPDMIAEELPRCWALPLVTLATIARTALMEQGHLAEPLMSAVREGVKYVRFVERNNVCELGSRYKRMWKSADTVWEGVDLYGRWLGVDLEKLVQEKEGKAIRELRDIATESVRLNGSPRKWTSRAVAADCMSRAAGCAMVDIENGVCGSELALVERLEKAMAVVLRDCLSNLPRAALRRCCNGSFGKREEGVREAAIVLGEAEEVLQAIAVIGL